MRGLQSIRQAPDDARVRDRRRGSLPAAVADANRSGRPACARAVLCLLVLVLLGSAGSLLAGYSSPSIANPIGPATVPPSSYQSGLVNTPDPIDASGNLLITGNVRGGKHFRGQMPYSTPTGFQATLGSTRLDSFLRYSAVPDELGPSTRGYDTFYSPTGTVSTIPPGQSRVFAPVSPRLAGGIAQLRAEQPADTVGLRDFAQTPQANAIGDGTWSTWQTTGNRPLSGIPRDMQDAISDELGLPTVSHRALPQLDQPIPAEDYQRQLQQFQQQLEKVKADASRLERNLNLDEDAATRTREYRSGEPIEPAAPQRSPEARIQTLQEPQRRSSALDRPVDESLVQRPLPLPDGPSAQAAKANPPAGQDLAPAVGTDGSAPSRLQLYSPLRALGDISAEPSAGTDRIAELLLPRTRKDAGQDEADTFGEMPALRRMKETSRAFDPASDSLGAAPKDAMGAGRQAPQRVSSLLDRLRTASASQYAAPGIEPDDQTDAESDSSGQLIGDRMRQKYEDVGLSSHDRFDRYMETARLYLKQGRYYRAAESFTLASLYKPQDAKACLGKAHALFAAGEYLSSVAFLVKAIELDPYQTLDTSDFVNALGGPEQFARRVTDLQQCVQTSKAPQLNFLLAYIHLQMGALEEAKVALEAAAKELPRTPAVDLLKAAIGR